LAGKTPEDIDRLFAGRARAYVGAGGRLRIGTNHEVAVEESLNTAFGVERIVRDAFTRATNRRGHVTLVHKTNVLTNAGSLWSRVFAEIAAEFPGVRTDYLHVDAASMFFITDPDGFDVVVTDNLFGDIITDIGAAIAGGIGRQPAATSARPGRIHMFEPVHGFARYAGKEAADPRRLCCRSR
jgi:3-isopropylmalate dehydrogenase